MPGTTTYLLCLDAKEVPGTQDRDKQCQSKPLMYFFNIFFSWGGKCRSGSKTPCHSWPLGTGDSTQSSFTCRQRLTETRNNNSVGVVDKTAHSGKPGVLKMWSVETETVSDCQQEWAESFSPIKLPLKSSQTALASQYGALAWRRAAKYYSVIMLATGAIC